MQEDTDSVGVYFKTGDEPYFSMESSSAFFKLFHTMWQEIKTIGKPPWSTAAFIIRGNGKFSVYFGSQDIFDGRSTSLERMKAWIRKYLGELQIKAQE
jgi:hypothetical protein